MKKIFGLLIFSLLLLGCTPNNNEQKDYEKIFNNAKEKLDTLFLNIEEVSSDLFLPTSFDDIEGLLITWISSDPTVLSNTGKYNPPIVKTVVTIEAILLYDNENDLISYSLNIKEEIKEDDEDKDDEDKDDENKNDEITQFKVNEAIEYLNQKNELKDSNGNYNDENQSKVIGKVVCIASTNKIILYSDLKYIMILGLNSSEVTVSNNYEIIGTLSLLDHAPVLKYGFDSSVAIADVEIAADGDYQAIDIVDLVNMNYTNQVFIMKIKVKGTLDFLSLKGNTEDIVLNLGIFNEDITNLNLEYVEVSSYIYLGMQGNEWVFVSDGFKIEKTTPSCPVC